MRMHKRTYRARKIKDLKMADLLNLVRGQRVVVTTDVAKTDMVSSIELWDGTSATLVKWRNPFELREFVSLVLTVGREAEEVECVQEPTGTYGDPLRVALQKAGLPVYRVSPKHVHDLQEVYDGTPSSHDPKAARVIARVHREGMSSLWTEHSPELTTKYRRYEWFMDEQTRLRGRVEARLARHWPEVNELLDLDSTTLLRLFERYGGPAAMAAAEADARSLMSSTGRGLLDKGKVEAVLRSAGETVGVPVTKEEAEELQLLARESLRIKEALRAEHQQLGAAGEGTPGIQDMKDVVGPATAVVIFALLGAPSGYGSAGAYIKAAGMNLREHSSGKKKGQLAISKRGPGPVRHMLYFAVMRLIQKDPLFKAWHERKMARCSPRQGKKSIIALARKLMGALWHVGQGVPFDSTRLFAQSS